MNKPTPPPVCQGLALALILAAGIPQAQAEVLYGLTISDRLISFESATPGMIMGDAPITGLGTGDSLLGIDYRPATGELYALGRSGSLYLIDRVTGNATGVGPAPISSFVSGDDFGFDFNPVVDRLRVVSDNGQNLRLNPNTGGVAGTDGSLKYAPGDPNTSLSPQIVGSAYTQNQAGATTTTLYALDSVLDVLVRQAPPNDGVLNTVGSLGVNISDLAGFDISGQSGQAFASFRLAGEGSSGLYTVDLGTGAATWVGGVGIGENLKGLTVVPEPSVLSLLGVGMAGALVMLRKRR